MTENKKTKNIGKLCNEYAIECVPLLLTNNILFVSHRAKQLSACQIQEPQQQGPSGMFSGMLVDCYMNFSNILYFYKGTSEILLPLFMSIQLNNHGETYGPLKNLTEGDVIGKRIAHCFNPRTAITRAIR